MSWRTGGLVVVLCGQLACAQVPPTVPHLLVVPRPMTSLPTFHADQQRCLAWATAQSAPVRHPPHVTTLRVVALVVSAALGGLLGAVTGQVLPGLALGVAFSVWGTDRLLADTETQSQAGWQARFDMAYAQCMAAAGHQVLPRWDWPGRRGPGEGR